MNDEIYEELAGIICQDDKELTKIAAEKSKNDDNALLESHNLIVSDADKTIISERSWDLFQLMYEYIGGFKSYESPKEMAETAEIIKFVYEGKLDDANEFDINKCLVIGTFNRNHGLKMTSIAANFICFDKIFVQAAARKFQRECFRFSWLECGGKAESFIIKCGGLNHTIDPEIIKNNVYPNREILINEDNVHYSRILTSTGKYVQKMAVGNISI